MTPMGWHESLLPPSLPLSVQEEKEILEPIAKDKLYDKIIIPKPEEPTEEGEEPEEKEEEEPKEEEVCTCAEG